MSLEDLELSDNGEDTITGQELIDEGYVYFGGTVTEYKHTATSGRLGLAIHSPIYNIWRTNRDYYNAEYVYHEQGGTGVYYQLTTAQSRNEKPVDHTGVWQVVNPESGNYFLTLHSGDLFDPIATTVTAQPTGIWSHFAVSNVEQDLSVYTNGIRTFNSFNESGISFNDDQSNFIIGKGGGVYDEDNFIGYMQDFRLFNKYSIYVDTHKLLVSLMTLIKQFSLYLFEPDCIFTDLHIQVDINQEKIYDISRNKEIFNYNNVSIVDKEVIRGNASLEFNRGFLMLEHNDVLSLSSGDFNIEFWVNFDSYPPSSKEYGSLYMEPTPSITPTPTVTTSNYKTTPTQTPTSSTTPSVTPTVSLTATPSITVTSTQTPTVTPSISLSPSVDSSQPPTPSLTATEYYCKYHANPTITPTISDFLK